MSDISGGECSSSAFLSRAQLARSNVTTSIKELLNWQLIHRVPILGDRRDHYAAETDIWEMVTRIAKGRKAREVDPAEAALKAATR